LFSKSAILKNRANDLRNSLVLEDPAIGVPRQQPKPRPQRGPIDRKIPLDAAVFEPADETVEISAPAAGVVQYYGSSLTEHLGAADVWAFAQ
jgi:hypothetical protein